MQPTNEYFKLDAYFNDDSGSGRFRGIGVQGNDQMRPIFEEWLKPFHDLGAATVSGPTALTARPPGGTHHTSFHYLGLPRLRVLPDPHEYITPPHPPHT